MDPFVPSPRLVSLIQEGVRMLVVERSAVGDGPVDFELDLSPENIRRVVEQQVTKIASALCMRVGAGLVDDLIVDRDRRFTAAVAEQLQEAIPVAPRMADAMLSALAAELHEYLMNGGRVSDQWGQLKATSDGRVIARPFRERKFPPRGEFKLEPEEQVISL